MWKFAFLRCGPLLFFALLFCSAGGLFAAPLESGYALAPRASATAEEKAEAAREARFRVLAAAGKYEKTPYRYGGMDKNGLDCSGFIFLSFRDALSVSVPRTTRGLYSWTEKITGGNIQPGDILFFKTDNTGQISHAGIYIGGNRFIHSASEGPVTGVIYSGLDEKYWSRTYAGAGRALPAADFNSREAARLSASALPNSGPERIAASGEGGRSSGGTAAGGKSPPAGKSADSKIRGVDSGVAPADSGKKKGRLMLGLAAAPSWNGFLADGNLVRGVAGQLRLGAETYTFKTPMIFGLELRPEWDGALGVFRLPVTLSWGLNDKFRIFLGPVFSFGDATLKTTDGNRHYSGGTAWIGAVGISAAPFSFKIAKGELAPYAELAWQSYFSDNDDVNLNADFAAGLRFSTGLRYTWKF
ncbi:MAG: C40 family peptidase [Treponema sp.]|jgi:probable lipoprotein NlpC|nr:C40 family peptidase [Treponema sp.]